jgi:hypothetical protein
VLIIEGKRRRCERRFGSPPLGCRRATADGMRRGDAGRGGGGGWES